MHTLYEIYEETCSKNASVYFVVRTPDGWIKKWQLNDYDALQSCSNGMLSWQGSIYS